VIHSTDTVLAWLRENCQHDRVLYNALNNHSRQPDVIWSIHNGWRVDAFSQSGEHYAAFVVPHAVTGEPNHFQRISPDQSMEAEDEDE